MKPLARIHEILLDLPPETIPELQMTALLKELRRAQSEYSYLQTKYDHAIQGKAVVHSLLQKSSEEMIERYRALFEYSGIPMVILNNEGIITLANSQFIAYTGIPLDELLNKTCFFDLISPDDRKRAQQYHIARRRHEKVPTQYDIVFIGRFSSSHDVTLSVGLMPGGNESLVSLNDITEKKKQRAELTAHNQQLETLLTLYQMTDEPERIVTSYAIRKGVQLTLSSAGFLVYVGSDVNNTTIQAFWSNESKSGEHEEIPELKQMIIPLKDLPHIRQVVHTGEALILDRNPHAPRVLTAIANHPFFYQRALIIPIIELEKTVAVACFIDKPDNYDVSDQMQLTLLMAGMWRLIMRNRQEEALKTANKKLGLLSSLTRHDIINLLTALDGYIELSHEIAVDPELDFFISKEKEIVRSISDIIAFTREYEMVGINTPIWQELKKIFDEVIMASSLAGIVVTYEVKGVWVYADPLLIRVFSNFVDNSLRHGGHVTVISVTWEKSVEDLILVYQDNGIGIPQEEKERIFIRGYGKNTGLGLFLIREIVAITGISIKETGNPGAGCRFEMRIPPESFRLLGDLIETETFDNKIAKGGK